ncbi:MAG TPA: energy transducer TonB [Terriglobales bacterium]|nr:energy transducer TonB [Terriglobales bacterium]
MVQQSAGLGATRLLAFSGEVRAGNAYHCEVTPRLTFALLPLPEGWRISITESGRNDDLAQFSEPVTGFNPLIIEAKQFLGKDGQPAPENALPAELKNREFIFSVEVGRSIMPAGNGAATPGQIEQITKDGRGTFKIESVQLTPAEPGGKPRIAYMTFETSMQLAGKNLEPGRRVFKVGGAVTPPKPVYTPDPEYDDAARKRGLQGTVVVWLIVGPDGVPRDLKVAKSLDPGLDKKAIEAVRQWKFEPSLKDGQPVAVPINVEVHFRLYHAPH